VGWETAPKQQWVLPTPHPHAFVAQGRVIELNEQSFDESISKGVWLVRFFAPWCAFSRQLTPIWSQLAGNGAGFMVGEVNCTVEKGLESRFDITGYPTIKLFREGSMYAYEGARTEEKLKEFVQSGWKTIHSQPIPPKGYRGGFRRVASFFVSFYPIILVITFLVTISLVVFILRRRAHLRRAAELSYTPVPLEEKPCKV